MKAIRVTTPGDPDVMRWLDAPDPEPGPGQVLIDVEAVGVNFIEIYQRSGQYPVPLPWTPGSEAAGVVRAVGAGVAGLAPGDRVGSLAAIGAYAERALVPADKAVRLPDGITTRQAAAALLQGITAHYLATSTRPLGPGDSAVVLAAAGGVGRLLVQIAKRRGATVIGVTSSEAKADEVRAVGADHALVVPAGSGFAPKVKELVQGGVDVVYDSVGRTSFEDSLACLAPRGMVALYGQSSGAVPPFDPQVLARGGSLYLTRPQVGHYVRTPAELAARADDVLGAIARGELRLHIHAELPLSEAARAHHLLASRQTTGKLLLVPG